jgi:hypothetical protein
MVAHPNYFDWSEHSCVKMALPNGAVIQASAGPAVGTQVGVVLLIAAVAIVIIEAVFGVEITGRLAGGAKRVIGLVPFVGDSDGDSGDPMFSTRTLLAVGFAVAVLAVASGRIISLPEGGNVQILVVMELIAVYLVLREFDAFSVPVYMIVTVATVVVALSALGEPIIASLSMSPVFPILAVGLLYLGYKGIQAWRASNTPTYTIRGTEK